MQNDILCSKSLVYIHVLPPLSNLNRKKNLYISLFKTIFTSKRFHTFKLACIIFLSLVKTRYLKPKIIGRFARICPPKQTYLKTYYREIYYFCEISRLFLFIDILGQKIHFRTLHYMILLHQSIKNTFFWAILVFIIYMRVNMETLFYDSKIVQWKILIIS